MSDGCHTGRISHARFPDPNHTRPVAKCAAGRQEHAGPPPALHPAPDRRRTAPADGSRASPATRMNSSFSAPPGPVRSPEPPGAPGRRAAGRNGGRGLYVVVALLTLVHLAALGPGPGSGLGDDFAQYVLHARNLVEGRPYADTGYLFNPLDPWFSPRTYPPGFPLLLAPIYAGLGVDFRAMKVLVALSIGGVLLLLALRARRDLGPAAAYAAVLLVGLHPYLWRFREHVLPDLPFTFFCLLALVPIARAGAKEAGWRERAAWAAASLPAIALAVATRTIGVVLVPTLLTVLLLRTRRPGRALVGCAAAAAALLAVRLLAFPPGDGYLRQVGDLVAVYGPSLLVPGADRLGRMAFALSNLWSGGQFPGAGYAAAAATGFLVLAGLSPRLRHPGAAEVFFVGYLAAVFLWPGVNVRYLVPVLPLYVFYAAAGAERSARRPAGRSLVALAALIVAVSYAGRYAAAGLGSPGGIGTSAEVRDLYRHVRERTPADAKFMAELPRALTLFTGRAAASSGRGAEDVLLLAFADSAGIDFLVARAEHDRARGVVERHPSRFVTVYSNGVYDLFRIVREPR